LKKSGRQAKEKESFCEERLFLFNEFFSSLLSEAFAGTGLKEKKARPKKSRPLLTYEKHQAQI
jgi:hypothetical protein